VPSTLSLAHSELFNVAFSFHRTYYDGIQIYNSRFVGTSYEYSLVGKEVDAVKSIPGLPCRIPTACTPEKQQKDDSPSFVDNMLAAQEIRNKHSIM